MLGQTPTRPFDCENVIRYPEWSDPTGETLRQCGRGQIRIAVVHRVGKIHPLTGSGCVGSSAETSIGHQRVQGVIGFSAGVSAKLYAHEILSHLSLIFLGETSLSPASDSQRGRNVRDSLSIKRGFFADQRVVGIEVASLFFFREAGELEAHFVRGDRAVRTIINPDLALAVVQLLHMEGHGVSLPAQSLVLLFGQVEPDASSTDGQAVLHVVLFRITRKAISLSQFNDSFRGGVVVARLTGMIVRHADGGTGIRFQKVATPSVAMHKVHEHSASSRTDDAVPVVRAVVHAHASTVGEDIAKVQPQDIGVLEILRRAA